MATAAQVLANRENSQHSTGPTSAEGKATSAKNATRHSLTARGFIVPLGQEEAFAAFESGLRVQLIPHSPFEEMLFTRILECGWNLERCRRASAELVEQQPAVDPLLNATEDPRLARIEKYARQYENSMYKAIRELRTVQTEAQFRDEIHPLTQEEVDTPELFDQTPQSLSAICDFQRVTAALSRQPKPQRRNFQNKADLFRAALDHLAAPPRVKLGPEPL